MTYGLCFMPDPISCILHLQLCVQQLICFIVVAFPDLLAWGYLLDIILPLLYLTTSFVTTIYFRDIPPRYLTYVTIKFPEYSSPSNSIT